MTVALTEIFSDAEWAELVEELSLSARQEQVVRCLFSGYSDKQIAWALDVSVATVRTHMARLFCRLGVQDRTELVLHLFRQFREGCRSNGCLSQCQRRTAGV